MSAVEGARNKEDLFFLEHKLVSNRSSALTIVILKCIFFFLLQYLVILISVYAAELAAGVLAYIYYETVSVHVFWYCP